MIKVEDLTKTFDSKVVVDNVSFEVAEQETLVLLGTSGSGKTTTLKMINRLIEPTSGSVTINGKNVLDENPYVLRKRIGYVIQNIGLFPHYTVEENIAMVPKLTEWNKNDIQNRTEELMEMLGLERELAYRIPDALSGGQKQRVGIARALAANPPLMLLDEPFGALDPLTKEQILKDFKKIDALRKTTIILVTHDISEAVELGNKICLLDEGKVQQFGVPRELLFKPKNDFVRDFFNHQRFQIELKVVTIADILSELPDSEPQDNVLQLDEEESLLNILEKVEKTQDSGILLRIDNDEVQKCFEPGSLLPAFYQFKSKFTA